MNLSTIPGFLNAFLLPNIKQMKELGYTIEVATSKGTDIPLVDKRYDIPIQRSPYKFKNIKAYRMLKKVINNGNYDIIDLHTPMGGMLGRMASRKARKKGTKVIYTAHGFHFFKGASKFRWLTYYQIEKYLSKKTDTLVTMNDEDFNISNKKFKTKNLYKINGVGIDNNRFTKLNDTERKIIRNEYGYNEDEFLITYVGELSKRKNQELLINGAKELKLYIPNLKILLVGDGSYKEKFKTMITANDLTNNVYLLGYRNDITELMNISNLIISTSLHEGLPVNIMEAMSIGKPILVSPCRGNIDLIKHNYNGLVANDYKVESYVEYIKDIYNGKYDLNKFEENNKKEIKKYEIDVVLKQYKEIYIV